MSNGLCVGGWGIGDCGSSGSTAQTEYNQTMSQLVSQTASYIQTNSSKTSLASVITQTTSLEIGGDIGPNCDITQSQTISLTSQATGNLNTQQLATMGSTITTSLQNMLTQTGSAASQLLSGSTSSSDITNINDNIAAVVSQTTSLSSYQQIISQTFAKQGLTLVVGGSCNGKIKQDEKFVGNVIALNIMTAIQTGLQNNAVTSSLFTQLAQTSNSHGGGLAELVSSFFSGIAGVLGVAEGPLFAGIAGCICILCVCCLALLAFGLSGAGQDSARTLSSGAVNIGKVAVAKMPPIPP